MKSPTCPVLLSPCLPLLLFGVMALPLVTAGTSPQIRIITGAGPGGGPHVKRFDFAAPQVPFFPRAFSEDAAGSSYTLQGVSIAIDEPGVQVAVGDLNKNGRADLITLTRTAGSGAGPRVRLYEQPIPNGGAVALGESYGGFLIPAADAGSRQVFTATATYPDGTSRIITGAGPGGGPHVKIFSPQGGELSTFTPYGASFNSGIRVAAGDITGDGVPDIIVAGGPGGGPHVKIFDGRNSAELFSVSPYTSAPLGGIHVAAGDVNGDGRADVITGTGPGAAPHVKIFSGLEFQVNQAPVGQSHFAFDASYLGGVRVATGDVDGDGSAEIFVAGAPGGSRRVEVLKGNLTGDSGTGREIWTWTGEPTRVGDQFAIAAGDLDGDGKAELVIGGSPGGGARAVVLSPRVQATATFDAYPAPFTGRVRVASGDVNGDGVADIITAAGAGGSPHVKVFDGATGAEIRSFFAYPASFTGGVSVAAGDVNGDGFADIITGAGPGAGPHVKAFSGANGGVLHDFGAFSPTFTGGVNVAACDLDDDGRCDMIIGSGAGGPPQVKVFDGLTGTEELAFLAFDPTYTGGVHVAACPTARILLPAVQKRIAVSRIIGGGPGGGPHVKIFDGITAAELGAFSPFGADFTGGITVASGDVDGDGIEEVLAAASPAVGGPMVVGIEMATAKVELTHRFALGSFVTRGPDEAPFFAISSRPVPLLEMRPPVKVDGGIQFAATGTPGTWLDFETSDDLTNWLPASSTFIPDSKRIMVGLLLPAVQKRGFVRAAGK